MLLEEDDMNKHKKEPITLKRLKFKCPLDLGNDDSLQFHTNLMYSRKMDIFGSLAIQQIINYKWDTVRRTGFMKAFLRIFVIVTCLVENFSVIYPTKEMLC